MRIYTVTRSGQPLAVVRATDGEDAKDTAAALAGEWSPPGVLDVREPSDAEMVGWLERREDYLVTEHASVS